MQRYSSQARPVSCASAIAAVIALFGPWTGHAVSAESTSPWVEGFNNKVRLLAGRAAFAGAETVFAGVEISMPPGWKTYWRTPGEAGGVPPEFDWTGSENLAAARVLYPAPHRLIDKSGAAIGYKDGVLFPVVITAKDAAQPVKLKLKAAYGVCREICIPAEAELDISIAQDVSGSAGISQALASVPGSLPRPAMDPALTTWKVVESNAKPRLVLEVLDPGSEPGDAFVDAPDGTYLPLPKKISEAGGKAVYELDLTDGVDLKALKGKTLNVTLTGGKGQSETAITLE